MCTAKYPQQCVPPFPHQTLPQVSKPETKADVTPLLVNVLSGRYGLRLSGSNRGREEMHQPSSTENVARWRHAGGVRSSHEAPAPQAGAQPPPPRPSEVRAAALHLFCVVQGLLESPKQRRVGSGCCVNRVPLATHGARHNMEDSHKKSRQEQGGG